MNLSAESLSVLGCSQYRKSTSNCWVCEMEVHHLSKMSHGKCSPMPPTPAAAAVEISSVDQNPMIFLLGQKRLSYIEMS